MCLNTLYIEFVSVINTILWLNYFTSVGISALNEDDVSFFRLLKLAAPVTIAQVILRVKQLTELQHVRIALGKGKSSTSEVAIVGLCAGSGSSVLKGVAADLYLTGKFT